MHSLQKQFHDFIHSNQLVKKGEKMLLAVSGGLDSMVMADLFHTSKILFAIAHCNYGLRGDESDSDEAFVMNWADKNKVNCHVKAFDVSHESVQLEARKIRYQWFNELAAVHGFEKIATAHHLNDSLETVIINLSRGTGIKGVAGISVKNANIIRPLLFATRQVLHDYALNRGFGWREDSSNQKTDYDRNLIRHHVMPKLHKLNPSLYKTFELTTERLAYAAEIIKQKVDEVRSQYLKKVKNGWQMDLSWISVPSDELVLAELLAGYGVNYVTAKEVFKARGKSGKSFPVGDWLIAMDRSTIFIYKNQTEKEIAVRIDSIGAYTIGNRKVVVEHARKDEVVFDSPDTGYFDAGLFRFPAVIRSWKAGDKFQPLGMKGEKKVSDFLIDEKIPLIKKKEVLVIESDNNLAWVVGYRVSNRFKVTNKTKEVIRMELSF